MADLTAAASVVLANVSGTVTGSVRLGPGQNGDRGPATWNVTGVITRTSRPGVAPIPRVQVVDQDGVDQGLTYDGSFNQGGCAINLTRGQYLTITWTGGAAGDVATATVTGTKQ